LVVAVLAIPPACTIDASGTRDPATGTGTPGGATTGTGTGTGSGTTTGSPSGTATGTGAGTTSGTPGGSATGTGVGGGGSGGAPPICAWTAGDPEPNGTYNQSLANSDCSLGFESPYTGERTSQTSAHTLRRGFDVDDARARNPGDGLTDWGLSVESERTNVIWNSDSWQGAGWTPGTMTHVADQLDPAGGNLATMFISDHPLGQYSPYQYLQGRVFSTWAKGGDCDAPGGSGGAGGAGGAGGGCSWFQHSCCPMLIEEPTWQRYDAAHPTGDSYSTFIIDTRGISFSGEQYPIGYRTETVAFGAQLEPEALYPSSYIHTSSAAATRDAETLYSNTPEALIQGGYFKVTFVLVPRYASDELLQDAQHDLLYLDDDNRVYLKSRINDNDGEYYIVLCITVGGSQACGGMVSWPRESELTITAEHSPNQRVATISGHETGNGDAAAQVEDPIVMGDYDNVYLLGNAVGAQECADLRSLVFDVPPGL